MERANIDVICLALAKGLPNNDIFGGRAVKRRRPCIDGGPAS